MEKIFQKLNESQSQAVKHSEGPVLILAGAGVEKQLQLFHVWHT